MAIPIPYPGLLRRVALYFADLLRGDDTHLRQRYEAAVREYTPLIDRICFGYAKTQADMDDLRQDSLLNLWESMATFQGQCSMKTWVYRLTLNSCVSTLRRNYRRPATVPLTQLCDVIEDDQRHQIMELHEAIAQLNPIDKAIILLWLEEESYDEIAAIVGLTKSNVAVRIHRAKDRLRTILNR